MPAEQNLVWAIKSDVGVPVFSTTAALIGGAFECRPRTIVETTAFAVSGSSELGLASGKPSAELMPPEAAGFRHAVPPTFSLCRSLSSCFRSLLHDILDAKMGTSLRSRACGQSSVKKVFGTPIVSLTVYIINIPDR